MANEVVTIATRQQRALAADFGKYTAGLPANVIALLWWQHITPEFTSGTLGWRYVVVKTPNPENHDNVGVLLALPRSDVEKALAVARRALEPSAASDCLLATARLRAVARQRPTVTEDEDLALAVYGDKLAKYPADVVAIACERWLETSPFWPSVSEILEACEWAMQARRSLAHALGELLKAVDAAPAERQRHLEALRHMLTRYDCTSDSWLSTERELAGLEGRDPRPRPVTLQ